MKSIAEYGFRCLSGQLGPQWKSAEITLSIQARIRLIMRKDF